MEQEKAEMEGEEQNDWGKKRFSSHFLYPDVFVAINHVSSQSKTIGRAVGGGTSKNAPRVRPIKPKLDICGSCHEENVSRVIPKGE